jgi:hypothetical protein
LRIDEDNEGILDKEATSRNDILIVYVSHKI